jgi:hypothetical protein
LEVEVVEREGDRPIGDGDRVDDRADEVDEGHDCEVKSRIKTPRSGPERITMMSISAVNPKVRHHLAASGV